MLLIMAQRLVSMHSPGILGFKARHGIIDSNMIEQYSSTGTNFWIHCSRAPRYEVADALWAEGDVGGHHHGRLL